jgi:hypothetical protein
LARADRRSGDQKGAAAAYAQLLEQWQQADESLPELAEAHDYMRRVKP